MAVTRMAQQTLFSFRGPRRPARTISWPSGNKNIRSGNNVLIHFDGYAANSYTVQYRNSFSSGAWVRLQNVFPAANGPIEVVDTIPAGNQARFYRLVTPATP